MINLKTWKAIYFSHITYLSQLQTMSISMYFAVSWLDPRLQINESATEWTEDRTGPLNVITWIAN